MKTIFTLLFIALLSLTAQNSFAQIQVLSGMEKGTYYQMAKDMNALLPQTQSIEGNDTLMVDFLDVRTTAGTAFNFDIITQKDHKAKVAMMQLDYLLLKQSDDILNETEICKDLVLLMPLSMEEIHLVSKKDDEIHSLADLAGRKVGIGTQREGTYSTVTYMKNVSKVNWSSRNINTEDAIEEMVIDKLDAFFVVGAMPLDLLKIMPIRSSSKFELNSVENINSWANYYQAATIPAGTYRWQNTDVSTYAVPSVIVVNMAKLTEEEKQQLIQWRATVTANMESLKANGHNAWKSTVQNWDYSDWPLLK
ncbi:MAG: hypothetical protein B7C24_03810 [Bacteroidetes bacterium 4572_77]|nr:MAG: hypothetical protein B7C24_03810 [Bacteroidetes bacterium 4572_77]